MIKFITGATMGFVVGLVYGLWQFATPDSGIIKVLSYLKGILEVGL